MELTIIMVTAVIFVISALLIYHLYQDTIFRNKLKVHDKVMVRFKDGSAFGAVVHEINDTAITVCDSHLKMHLVSIYDIYEA